MEVRIDGEALKDSPPHDARIGDVIAQMRDRWSQAGRLLVEIGCDDEDVSGTELEALLDTPLSDFDRVEFRTGSAGKLAAEVLDRVSDMLTETRDIQLKIVDLLTQGATSRAMELLAGSFAVWNQAQQSIGHVAQVLGIDLDEVEFDGGGVTAFLEELTEALRRIREALEARDYVLLADALTYELDPIAERWPRLNEALLLHAGVASR